MSFNLIKLGKQSILKNTSGVSLIELLIVISILGIIAAIATPAYNNYRLKSNRTEARTELVDSAQAAERFFTRNNTYTGAISAYTSSHGFYNITFVAGGGGTTYVLTATATGPQVSDTPCLTMTLNQAGTRSPAGCW